MSLILKIIRLIFFLILEVMAQSFDADFMSGKTVVLVVRGLTIATFMASTFRCASEHNEL